MLFRRLHHAQQQPVFTMCVLQLTMSVSSHAESSKAAPVLNQSGNSELFTWVPPEQIANAAKYRQEAVLWARKRPTVTSAKYVIEPEPHDMRAQHKKVWLLSALQQLQQVQTGRTLVLSEATIGTILCDGILATSAQLCSISTTKSMNRQSAVFGCNFLAQSGRCLQP